MYNLLPIWLIAVFVGGLLFVLSEAAYRLARRRPTPFAEAPFDVALAPAFTLAALLLGFVFSMALARYDARGAAVLHEATGIREAGLLADTLDHETSEAMKKLLLKYTQARLDFAKADARPSQRAEAAARSQAIHAEMWQLAVEAVSREPQSSTVPLMVESLNELNTLSVEEAAVLADYIPPAVILMLILISAISSTLLGLRLGCHEHSSGPLASGLLAVMLALILGTVIDLDQPQRGFIRVSLEPFQVVQKLLQT